MALTIDKSTSLKSNYSTFSIDSDIYKEDSTYLIETINFKLSFEIAKEHKILQLINIRNLELTNTLINVIFVNDNNNQISWTISKSFSQIQDFLISFERIIINSKFNEDDLINDLVIFLKRDYKSKGFYDDFLKFANLITASYKKIRNMIFFLEFFEISLYSFETLEKGIKYKEGYILKKRRKKVPNNSCFQLLFCCGICQCKVYSKQWFILKEDMMYYIEKSYNILAKDIVWFDQNILIENSFFTQTKPTLKVTNNSRILKLKFDNEIDHNIWEDEISNKIYNFKKQKFKFDSFAPERDSCKAKYFIDANDYFHHLALKLNKAKESIFICGWWISPELPLIRPFNVNEYDNKSNPYILKNILLKLAISGVKIYIIVYKEFKYALNIDSLHTKNVFKNLHSNIKFIRYPKGNFELFWSPHDKLVVIDQKVGYLGGVDLCWGRYDDNSHKLFEKGSNDVELNWPGIEYNNVRINDIENVDEVKKESVDRKEYPRMPWHDIHCYLEGNIITDLSKHFIEKWSNIKNSFIEKYPNMIKRTDNRSSLIDSYIEGNSSSMIENKNYNQENPFTMIKNNSYSTSFMKESFIPKVDKLSFKTKKDKIEKEEGFLKKFKNTITTQTKTVASNIKKVLDFKDNDIPFKILQKGKLNNIYNYNCQLVRSATNWSVGSEVTESSILEAYLYYIEKAENYIFIENQFFISRPYNDLEREKNQFLQEDYVSNRIALKIREKITQKFMENKKFRVFILIPLLPGFSGDIESDHTLQVLVKFTYSTISKNRGFSLLELLYSLMGDQMNDYIIVLSLRTHEINPYNKIPNTEIIYIHSKLMLIDDNVAIIGSANINDRSMLGWRDCEINCIIKHGNKVLKIINDESIYVSEFIHNLRVALLSEHLGINIDDPILEDPLNDNLFKLIRTNATINTESYEKIFPHIYPANHLKSISDIIEKKRSKKNKEILLLYNEYHQNIKGNIVLFPLDFLKNEDMDVTSLREIFMPIKNYL